MHLLQQSDKQQTLTMVQTIALYLGTLRYHMTVALNIGFMPQASNWRRHYDFWSLVRDVFQRKFVSPIFRRRLGKFQQKTSLEYLQAEANWLHFEVKTSCLEQISRKAEEYVSTASHRVLSTLLSWLLTRYGLYGFDRNVPSLWWLKPSQTMYVSPWLCSSPWP